MFLPARATRHAAAHPGGAVTGVAPTPDGLHWLTAGTDDRVRLWDAGTYRCERGVGSERGRQGGVQALSRSPELLPLIVPLSFPQTRTHRHLLVHYQGAFNRATQARQLALSGDGGTLFHPSGSAVQVCLRRRGLVPLVARSPLTLDPSDHLARSPRCTTWPVGACCARWRGGTLRQSMPACECLCRARAGCFGPTAQSPARQPANRHPRPPSQPCTHACTAQLEPSEPGALLWGQRLQPGGVGARPRARGRRGVGGRRRGRRRLERVRVKKAFEPLTPVPPLTRLPLCRLLIPAHLAVPPLPPD